MKKRRNKSQEATKEDEKKIKEIKKQFKNVPVKNIRKAYFDDKISAETEKGRIFSNLADDFEFFGKANPNMKIKYTSFGGKHFEGTYKQLKKKIDRNVKLVMRRQRSLSEDETITSDNLPLLNFSQKKMARREIPTSINVDFTKIYSFNTPRGIFKETLKLKKKK